jgi:hypothetical protein
MKQYYGELRTESIRESLTFGFVNPDDIQGILKLRVLFILIPTLGGNGNNERENPFGEMRRMKG